VINNIKKILFFGLLFLVIPAITKADGIEIVNYETTININQKRIASISEKYSIYFAKNKKEIVRGLDKKLDLIRPDKSSIVVNSKISNLTSKNKLELIEESNVSNVKIKVEGQKDSIKEVNFKYDYNLGKDESRKYDEFYYNIVSNFDNLISNVAFELVLPKGASVKKIDFAIDGKYNLTKDDISYEIKDGVITGYLNTMLSKNQEFSVIIQFPNGFFKNTTDNFNYLLYLYLPVQFILFIIIFIFWYKYGKGNKIKEEFSYYPPYNFDPAEIGYLYKGKAEELDITSVIISLANQGYLRIEEYDDGYKLNKENSFKFIKIKDYDKKNAAQKILFEGIFKNRDEALLKDIEYTIMDKLLDAKKVLDNKDNRKKMFHLKINSVKLISVFLISFAVLLLNIQPIKIYTGTYLYVPLITIIMTFGLFTMIVFNNKFLVRLLFGFNFVFGSLYLGVYSLLGQNQLLIIYLINALIVLIMVIIYKKIPIRTKFGNEKLGQVYGFKIMLEGVSPYKLKELLEENPNYYYEMIPYASVFGILDEWMNKGKDIIKSSPNWHISPYDFKIKTEAKFMKNLLYTTTQVLVKGIYAKVSNIEFEEHKTKTNLND